MVLAVLGIVWLVVIGSYIKEKASTKAGDSVSAFRDQLSTLQRTQPGRAHGAPRASNGRLSTPPPSLSNEARMRRRNVLFSLVGLAAFTFLAALVTGSAAMIALNVLCDLAAAAYVALLVNQQRIAQEQRAKVRRIRPVTLQQVSSYGRTAVAGGQRFR